MAPVRILALTILLTLALQPSVSKKPLKILVYNVKFAHSHVNFLGRLADILVEAGHNVTTLMPQLCPGMDEGTRLSKIIRTPVDADTRRTYTESMSFAYSFETSPYEVMKSFKLGWTFGDLFYKGCKQTLQYPGLMDQLRAEKYDVMFTENFDLCGMGISHVIGVNAVIHASTSVLYGEQFDEFGVPQALSYNPSHFTTSLNIHSMWDRAWNVFGEWVFRHGYGYSRTSCLKAFREVYGPSFPTMQEISSRVAYSFTNSEPLLDVAHPTLHRIIDLGGLGARPIKPLNESWLEILSRRPRTVLVSFGSVAFSNEMPGKYKDGILNALKQFPDTTFIWKYEDPSDDFAHKVLNTSTNIVLSKWTPQQDLLAHDNLTAFVTHGGIASLHETARLGKPCLITPLFFDQPRNAYTFARAGSGKVFNKLDLADSDKFAAAIRTIMEDDRYRTRALRHKAMLKSKPFTPAELLIKYTEFAAAFNPSEALRPQSLDMSMIELYNLDLIAVVAALLAFITFAFVYFFLKGITFFFSSLPKIIVKMKRD